MVTYANIYKNVTFGLYGYDESYSLSFEETKEDILNAFKEEYEATIKERLKKVGLKLIGFDYYSPKEYNFENDNIDTIIKVADKNKLKKAILKHEDTINKRLLANKSYDGYMATTIGNVSEEIEALELNDYEPDIIVIQELLNLDCKGFDIADYFVYEELKEVERKWN